LSNAQYYDKFNTKVDVANALKIEFVTTMSQEYMIACDTNLHINKKIPEYEDLTTAEQQWINESAQEPYLARIFLFRSGRQHAQLWQSLKQDYAKSDDKHPNTRQAAFWLLEQFATLTPVTDSHGTAFSQQQGKGSGKGKGKGKSKNDDCASGTKHNKGLKCSYCNVPHPEDKSYKKSYNKQEAEKMAKVATKPLDSTIELSSNKSANKSAKKAFTKVFDYSNAQVCYESNGSSGASYFQYGLGFHQHVSKLEAEAIPIFPRIGMFISKAARREVVWIFVQWYYWIIIPQWIVLQPWHGIQKMHSPMKLQSNGGRMYIHHKGKVLGYHTKM